jgi:protein SCO1/2
MSRLALAILLLIGFLAGATAQEVPRELSDVKIDQRLGEQVPLNLEFRDSTGKLVRLGDLFQDRPVVLVLAYYRCPRLCSQVINGVIESLNDVSMTAGKDFNVIIASFDPEETYELAAKNRELALQLYKWGPESANGWHFLTGETKQIKPLAEAVGFNYVYDPHERIYKHSAGIMVLTPGGKVSRYLFGLKYGPKDLQLALYEASEGRIGSFADQALLLTCLAYDPTTGKYTVAVFKLMRLAAIVTVLCVGLYLWRNWRRERYKARAAEVAMSSGSSSGSS